MPKTKSSQRISRFMALVLRHEPDAANTVLDREGWTSVAELLRGMSANGYAVTRDQLDAIVAEDAKGRYSFSSDGSKIRANQGHSVDIQMTFEQLPPPPLLYHGTVSRSLDMIFRDGLRKMRRHHVHLSADFQTATDVGARRGRPIVLEVRAATMADDGYAFYRSSNGVWLVDAVPQIYLSIAFDHER